MVERDEKGFIKTGHAVVNAPAWKGMSRSPGPLETSWPGYLCRRRRALRLGETLRRRSG